MQQHNPLLSLKNVSIGIRGANYPIVSSLSLDLFPSETVAIVGESGSGKTLTASSILRLFSSSNIEILGGQILFEGQNLLEKSDKEMRALRASSISYIPQNPLNALNPTLTVGEQLIEGLDLSREEATKHALENLHHVGINNPEVRFHNYPHELSGGMRQRVLIAMSLMKHPKLLIADEPTTALDVTVQAEILVLLQELQKKFSMALLFITHDFGIVASIADRVAVMFKGQIVEEGSVFDIFKTPLHPYTQHLLHAIPRICDQKDLSTCIDGVIHETKKTPGCPFAARCKEAMQVCVAKAPTPYTLEKQTIVSVHAPTTMPLLSPPGEMQGATPNVDSQGLSTRRCDKADSPEPKEAASREGREHLQTTLCWKYEKAPR